jgi:hypothetical protein
LLNLIFAQKGNELVISINGTTDSLTVSNWYRGSSYQIEELETSNGSVLSGTQVGQLIQAMATFTKDEGISWSDVIQEKPEEVRDVLSQFWVSQQQ